MYFTQCLYNPIHNFFSPCIYILSCIIFYVCSQRIEPRARLIGHVHMYTCSCSITAMIMAIAIHVHARTLITPLCVQVSWLPSSL